MPSALCSISHWVQILDTAVRDQPLSLFPAADVCHLGQLHWDMLGDPLAVPLVPGQLYWGEAGGTEHLTELCSSILAGGMGYENTSRPAANLWGRAAARRVAPVQRVSQP